MLNAPMTCCIMVREVGKNKHHALRSLEETMPTKAEADVAADPVCRRSATYITDLRRGVIRQMFDVF